MKRDVVVIKERFETVDLEALDGPALCLRKKHMEARLSAGGEATDDEHYFARREVQRVDAELGRRLGALNRAASLIREDREEIERVIDRITVSDPVVHVLHSGIALCGKPGIPRNWERGHFWVGITEGAKEATCEPCRAALSRG